MSTIIDTPAGHEIPQVHGIPTANALWRERAAILKEAHDDGLTDEQLQRVRDINTSIGVGQLDRYLGDLTPGLDY